MSASSTTKRNHFAAWMLAAISLSVSGLIFFAIDAIGGWFWPLTPCGLFATIYPAWLLFRAGSSDENGDWTWRAYWRALKDNIGPAIIPIALLYTISLATTLWQGWAGLVSFRMSGFTSKDFSKLAIKLYANHYNILPVLHLIANTTLVYCWRKIRGPNSLRLLAPLTLLFTIRLGFLSMLLPYSHSLFHMLTFEFSYEWRNFNMNNQDLMLEVSWLIFKLVWAFMLVRMNVLRARQGLGSLDFYVVGGRILDSLFTKPDREESPAVRLLALHRRTVRLYWLLAAMYPVLSFVIHLKSGASFEPEFKLLYLGLIWMGGTMLVGLRWMSLAGSASRRAVMLDLMMMPVPPSEMFRSFLIAPIRHYLRLMGPVILFTLVETCLVKSRANYFLFYLLGAIGGTIILYLIFAPAILYNLLLHRSIPAALLKGLGQIFLFECIIAGSAYIIGEHLNEEELAVSLAVLLQSFLLVWALDYLILLRGDFFDLTVAPSRRGASRDPM